MRVLASFCLSFSLRCGGRPEGGQGLQTLQLARCELLACAESAEHGVGRYRAVKKATVRECAHLKSDIVGSVEAGEVINVLELSSDTAARAAASPQGRLALCGAHSLAHAKCQARAHSSTHAECQTRAHSFKTHAEWSSVGSSIALVKKGL